MPLSSASASPVALAQLRSYVFRRAETAAELEQLCRLNHRVFAGEVAQHAPNELGLLIDRFHHKNVYFLAERAGEIVGMIALHDEAPFSVAEKLSDPAALARLGDRLLEVRLLAIAPEERFGRVFAGLLYAVYQHARRLGHTHLVISGVAERMAIYEKLGFRALGPAQQSGHAWFTPMAVAVEDLPEAKIRRFRRWAVRPGQTPISLLPGPVQIGPRVREAFARPALSHRGTEFLDVFARVRQKLEALAGGVPVGLFSGTGTMANDIVAAALRADPVNRRGLILMNGEFGERLARLARRWQLPFEVRAWEWGAPWNLPEIAAALDQDRSIDWIWAVHLETSTGVLNDVAGLEALATARGVRVCLDCVSSLAGTPVNLRRIWLASSVSGKCIGSYAGTCFVFAQQELVDRLDSAAFPASLDLPEAIRARGPLFTFSSPQLLALEAALEQSALPERLTELAGFGRYVRQKLRAAGITPVAPEEHAAPVITTFAPPPGTTCAEYTDRAQAAGVLLAADSAYLRERRWLQIATMGALSFELLEMACTAVLG